MIRKATLGIATAALLGAAPAMAQDQTAPMTPAPSPQPMTTPGATMPDAATGAMAAPPAQPAPSPQTPSPQPMPTPGATVPDAATGAVAAPPAQPAPTDPTQPAAADPAAPAEPPPPPTPPTEEALYLIQALDTVCAPLLQGQAAKAVAKQVKYRVTRDGLLLKLPAGKSLTVIPPTTSNPTVCRINVAFQVDQWRPIVEALNTWAYARTPPLLLLYQGYRPMTGSTTTWSWEHVGPPQMGLGFTATKKADGSPSGRNVDLGTLVYNVSQS